MILLLFNSLYLLETANILNKDLDKIRGWAKQWKMAFNPEQTKQLKKSFFQKNPQESFHPNLYFNIFGSKSTNSKAFRA